MELSFRTNPRDGLMINEFIFRKVFCESASKIEILEIKSSSKSILIGYFPFDGNISITEPLKA